MSRTRKNNVKRRKNLDYVLLNDKFKGSEAHHLDTKNVIHITGEFRRGISHRLSQSKIMNQINNLAWDYLEASCL
jgi:hypothetical protein